MRPFEGAVAHRLAKVCPACPSAWEIESGSTEFYIKCRHGMLRVFVEGDQVFEENVSVLGFDGLMTTQEMLDRLGFVYEGDLGKIPGAHGDVPPTEEDIRSFMEFLKKMVPIPGKPGLYTIVPDLASQEVQDRFWKEMDEAYEKMTPEERVAYEEDAKRYDGVLMDGLDDK